MVIIRIIFVIIVIKFTLLLVCEQMNDDWRPLERHVLLYLITGMMLMTAAVFHIPAGRRAK